ncbi:helix-turn-helix domain-containing protein [Methylocystis hirsuta]|uniref:helix-turn-helix domain-containing protein n=1 Tax=Methylocystis hirsuta TaxID=369798 RepID=UPI00147451FB|nr:helix-turn-helix domain-containing protein [Methylocystis hirsuta]
MTHPNLLTLDEARQELRIGRSTIFKHLNSGALKDVRIGGRRFIALTEIERVLKDGLPSCKPKLGRVRRNLWSV